MNRRGFLSSILAAAVAPAIVRADSLMRVIPLETTILLETGVGGVTNVSVNSLLWPGVNAWWGNKYKESYPITNPQAFSYDILLPPSRR